MKKLVEKLVPTKDTLDQLKKARHLIFPDDDSMKNWYENYSSNHLNRLSFDLEYLKNEFPVPNGIKVLELGSSPLLLTVSIKNIGFDITGLDVAPERFSKAINKNNLFVVKAKIGEGSLPFEENTFDAIIMNEVFEHLNVNLITTMKDIYRILKPGGKLFISTPNLKSIIGIRNFLLRGKAYSCCGELFEEHNKVFQYGHMGHVREYTSIELREFLLKMDFKIEQIIYRGKYPLKYRFIDVFLPKLKPFFSIIVSK